jgi:1-deoxy-D-xylulose-5-phosphate reductoisomerase
MSQVRTIAILGSTGSIGCSTLEVAAAFPDRIRIAGLTANSRLQMLCEQAIEVVPSWIVATDIEAADQFDWGELSKEVELWQGSEGIERLVKQPEIDIVVAAIVGSAGLTGTWAALKAGKSVALANKEALVMAGPQITRLAAKHGGQLIPVDSEHSAIFQALAAGRREDVRRIVLTASGGPFLRHSASEMANVTVAEALDHPTWEMGQKITIDSATMMNKALEVIEARWLFDLSPEQIEVVVHPQSIVHSLVEFQDGSVVAQLSPPDMKLPIQYALSYPQRWDGPAARLDLSEAFALNFEPPDLDRFPALVLGFEVADRGGTAGAVLNAANEAAVASFLKGEIAFQEIVPACRAVLEQHDFEASPDLAQLIALDSWARQEVRRWVCT